MPRRHPLAHLPKRSHRVVAALAIGAAACRLSLEGSGAALYDTDAGAPVEADGAPVVGAVADAAGRADVAAPPPPVDADDDEGRGARNEGGADVAQEVGPLDAAPDAPPRVTLRINVAGGAHVGATAATAGAWSGDPGAGGVCGPSMYGPVAVAGPDGPLYAAEMYGNPLVCSVGGGSLLVGAYDVTLHFAEIYFGAGCPGGGGVGSRRFNIELEGATVATNVDVFQLSGGCLAAASSTAQPVALTYRVNVLDGTLSLRLPSSTNNAKISAIQLVGPM